MNYRRLGKTGLMVSEIGLGGEWLERHDSAECKAVIDRADGVTNLCEIKYCRGPYVLSKEECAKLVRRRDVFKATTRTRKSVHLTMITPEGVAETPERHFLQSELTLDDLFRP